MANERQIEANRRNAQKSTGPRTEEGRAAVRFNSLKHGLTAKSVVIPGESAEAFEAHLDRYFTEKSPTTAEEEDLVLQMAVASWCKRRLYRVVAAFYTYELEDHKDSLDKYHSDLNADGRVAYIASHDDNRHTIANLSRYQAQQERSFRTASEHLHRLRKQAKQETQPEDSKTRDPELEETKALVIPIGFASQKKEDPPAPAEKEPAARKIGFVSSKIPAPAAANIQCPKSNIQDPTSAVSQYPIPCIHENDSTRGSAWGRNDGLADRGALRECGGSGVAPGHCPSGPAES